MAARIHASTKKPSERSRNYDRRRYDEWRARLSDEEGLRLSLLRFAKIPASYESFTSGEYRWLA